MPRVLSDSYEKLYALCTMELEHICSALLNHALSLKLLCVFVCVCICVCYTARSQQLRSVTADQSLLLLKATTCSSDVSRSGIL